MKASSFSVPFMLCVLLAGCKELDFKALTPAPPGRVATLDGANDTIRISKDVALAIECTGRDSSSNGPCTDVTASVDDVDTLGLLEVDVDDLAFRTIHQGSGWSSDAQKPAIYVVVGKAVGSTLLHFSTNYGSVDFKAEVLPP
jgi:hypothetical protein